MAFSDMWHISHAAHSGLVVPHSLPTHTHLPHLFSVMVLFVSFYLYFLIFFLSFIMETWFHVLVGSFYGVCLVPFLCCFDWPLFPHVPLHSCYHYYTLDDMPIQKHITFCMYCACVVHAIALYLLCLGWFGTTLLHLVGALLCNISNNFMGWKAGLVENTFATIAFFFFISSPFPCHVLDWCDVHLCFFTFLHFYYMIYYVYYSPSGKNCVTLAAQLIHCYQ